MSKAKAVNMNITDIFLLDDLIKLAVYTCEKGCESEHVFPAGNLQGSTVGSLYALLRLICEKYQKVVEAFDTVPVAEEPLSDYIQSLPRDEDGCVTVYTSPLRPLEPETQTQGAVAANPKGRKK